MKKASSYVEAVRQLKHNNRMIIGVALMAVLQWKLAWGAAVYCRIKIIIK